jgi:myo-inositol-1(or 4)-monophosphatase
MRSAAMKASRALIRDFGEVENLQVSQKGPGDYVSAADHRAEKTLREELERARPGYCFVLEEGGVVEGPDKSHRWHIDPIDGTTNFLHSLPHFAISIALEREGQLVAALIYAPVLNELFWAEKGKGAWLNDKRLRVAGRKRLADSIIATGIPFSGKPGHELFLGELREVMSRTAGVRRYGSAALDLAYVAAGRFDGFWERGLKSWDIAAGTLLVREAGGLVTDESGRSDDVLSAHATVAGNFDLQPELIKVLASVGK